MYKKVLVVVLLLLLAFLISCGGGKKQPVNGSLSTAIGDSAAAPDEKTIMRPAPWSGDRDTTELEGNFTRPEPAKTTSAISGPRFTPTSDSIRQGLEYMLSVRDEFAFPQLGGLAYPNVWEWYVGQNSANPNIQGVVASGMLRASLTQGENANAYFDEALKTVDDYIVESFTTGPRPANYSNPYAHDVYSLYLAYEKTGDSSYIELANDLVHRTMTAYAGAAYADKMIDERYSLAGWDAAAYIYAFYLAGEASNDQAIMDWAVAMANRMVDRWDDWDHAVYGGWDLSMVSYGGMIKALTIVPDVNGKGYAGKVDYMRNAALAAQMNNGSFPVWYGAGPNDNVYDDVQATAYLLEALNIDDDATTDDARSLAERYLRSADIQMSDGKFVTYIDDTGLVYPEVCSEVLMALASQKNEIVDYAGTVWTVDDDRAQFPGADFTHPQDAVNAASAGDTILVYPGTYDSRIAPSVKPPHSGNNDRYAPALIVYKDDLLIKAVDSNPDNTIIQSTHDYWSNPVAVQWSTGGTWNGSAYVGAGVNPTGGSAPNAISVIASGVTIEGFTLRKPFMGVAWGGFWNTAGVMIGGLLAGDSDLANLGSDGNTVQNCKFRDVWHAVYIWHSSDNNILNNAVENLYGTDHWAAISIYDGYNDAQINLGYHSKGNQIVGNTIANKGISVGAWDPPTWTDNEGTIVIGNTCTQVGAHYSHNRKLFSHNGSAGYWTANADSVVVPTNVAYTGDASFVYDTPISLSAKLNFQFGFDAGQPGNPEDGSGFDVDITIDGTTYSGTTDASGEVSVSVPAGLSAGTYDVDIVAFIWGDYSHTAQTTIDIVPVTSIDYTGQLLWASKDVTLQATLVYYPPEADASGFVIEFFVDGTSVGTATTDSSGVASLDWTLGEFGIYEIKCTYEDMEDTATLVAYNPSENSFVTGGGWITGTNQPKANFGFTAKLENGVPSGTLSYSDGDITLVDSPVVWLVVQAEKAYFGGDGWFAIATDNGEPGKNNNILEIAEASGYTHSGKLGGGNIKVHKK